MALFRDYWMPDLTHRSESVELMDDTTADEEPLFATLRDFKYINRFVSRIQRVLRETVIADIKRRKAGDVSILDIASGGCDAGLWFARYCRNRGITCSVHCLDSDPRALRYARKVCREEPSIHFIEADARDIPGLGLTVDYAFTNHFLHHLPDGDIPGMLRAINGCARRGFVVHDLERAYRWFFGFTVLGGILWHDGFTLADGRMSIRRGFRRAELEHFLAQSGIPASISRSGIGHWRIANIPA